MFGYVAKIGTALFIAKLCVQSYITYCLITYLGVQTLSTAVITAGFVLIFI